MICANNDCTAELPRKARSNQLYCCKACCNRARYSRYNNDLRTVSCKGRCGTKFKQKTARNVWCSAECRKAYYRRTRYTTLKPPARTKSNGTGSHPRSQMPVPLASEAQREENAANIEEQMRRVRAGELTPIYLGGE